MKTEVLSPYPRGLETAITLLEQGQVVGIPTETVYGLAGNAFDERALVRIFEAKERPTFDPLIVHVPENWNSLELLNTNKIIDLSRLSETARKIAQALIERFWPGPLTLVLPKHSKIPDLVTSGLPTVAVRMPRHPVARELLTRAQFPLAAPSANRFGRISPTSDAHVYSELGGRIPLILDGGECEIGLESTVVAIGESGAVLLLRPGQVSKEDIETATKGLAESAPMQSFNRKNLASPGMLQSHYAPRKDLKILDEPVHRLSAQSIESIVHLEAQCFGLLVFSGTADDAAKTFSDLTRRTVIAQSLSESGNLEEAARQLFAKLRELDESQAEVLFVEPCPEQKGLGHAIKDRLTRAAAPRT